MSLYVFGDSNCRGYNLDSEEKSWPALLSQHLGTGLINKSEVAVDNFFIYQSILQECHNIKDNDYVVVGWTHPNRKTFVMDKTQPKHVELLPHSLTYQTGDMDFFRYDGTKRGNPLHRAFNLDPQNSGHDFFDTWFKLYHSDYEQKTQLCAFVDSVKLRFPRSVNFFFSKESMHGINIDEKDTLCILDFIVENKLYISKSDYHLNDRGHKILAELLLAKIPSFR